MVGVKDRLCHRRCTEYRGSLSSWESSGDIDQSSYSNRPGFGTLYPPVGRMELLGRIRIGLENSRSLPRESIVVPAHKGSDFWRKETQSETAGRIAAVLYLSAYEYPEYAERLRDVADELLSAPGFNGDGRSRSDKAQIFSWLMNESQSGYIDPYSAPLAAKVIQNDAEVVNTSIPTRWQSFKSGLSDTGRQFSGAGKSASLAARKAAGGLTDISKAVLLTTGTGLALYGLWSIWPALGAASKKMRN